MQVLLKDYIWHMSEIGRALIECAEYCEKKLRPAIPLAHYIAFVDNGKNDDRSDSAIALADDIATLLNQLESLASQFNGKTDSVKSPLNGES